MKWILLLLLIPTLLFAQSPSGSGYVQPTPTPIQCEATVTDFPIINHGTIQQYGGYSIPNNDVLVNAYHPDPESTIRNRGFLQFDTSSIGTQNILKVEFQRNLYDYAGAANYDFRYLLDGSLTNPPDPTTAWSAGVQCYAENAAAFSDSLIDLGADGIAAINKTGITTLIWKNAYNDDSGNENWLGGAHLCVLTNPCFLRVTTGVVVRKKWLIRAAQ